MKRILFIVCVLGMVTFANAQTSAPAKARATVTVKASRVTQDSRLPSMLLNEAVEIVVPGVFYMDSTGQMAHGEITVTADEALMNSQLGSMELRGNVRVMVPPALLLAASK